MYEIYEDPSHTFLKMKSFTSDYYLVREDYQIPTGGNVTCAYLEEEKLDDKKTLEALTNIISQE